MASEGSIRIPEDIITNILYHLPAKSLGRFKCLSKNWLALISEPQFIKTHHNINTHKRCHFIFVSNDHQLYSLPIPNHEAEPVLEPTKIPLGSDYFILDFDGSCNGLVLVSTSFDVIVLNPTTGESVRFQDPIIRKINNVFKIGNGFGYDSGTNHYKVVTISCSDNYGPDNMYIHVYCLKTNTWRRVKDSPYTYSRWRRFPGVFVNGFLHWVANKGSDGYLPVIVAFSLAKEKFTELPWPNWDDSVCRMDFKLFDLGGKLAVFQKDEIWLMNEYGVRESWTKVVLHGLYKFPRFEPLSFYDNGKILMVSNDRLYIHDIGERTSCSFPWNMNDLIKSRGTYVESLVSPKFTRTMW